MPMLKRHPLVRVDLQCAYDGYEDELPGLGGQFQNEFLRTCRKLAKNPMLYAVRFSSIRRLNLDRFPYGKAVRGTCGTGGARCSVRAGVINPRAWIGNRGGQRTARPTRRCAKEKLNCHIFHTVKHDEVRVLAVLHASRETKSILAVRRRDFSAAP